jgi:hypothetical protein
MRRRHWGPVLPLILLLALPLAGCGGSDGGSDGVASAGGDAAATPTTSAEPVSDDEARLKFAQCMRENGIDVPDPEPSGGGGMRIALGEGVDPQKAQAAMEKCRSHLPNGGERMKLDPEQVENLRKLAQCMRDNGVEDFPDPSADGTVQFGGAGRNIDPNDPTVRAALEKCQQYAPRMRSSAGATG